MVTVKRVYDETARADGARILIDRLWPRGVTKADADVAEWAKDLAPSKELFAWFHEDKENRFPSFQQKYKKELSAKRERMQEILRTHKRVTLITSVKDIAHSHIPVLEKFFKQV